MHLVIITGASSGFGSCILQELAKGYHESLPCHVVILSRDEAGMKNSIEKAKEIAKDKVITFSYSRIDLEKVDEITNTIEELAFQENNQFEVKRLSIFHNSGALSPFGYLLDCNDPQEWGKCFQLNVTSTILLTNAVLSRFSTPILSKIRIINISSLLAIKPFPGMGAYSIAKAARDMYMKALDADWKATRPEIDFKTLSYAPGPMDTPMGDQVRTLCANKDIRQVYETMKEKNSFVDCGKSVQKLLSILSEDTYNSGSHIDFFDLA